MEKLPHETDYAGDDDNDYSRDKIPEEDFGNTPKNADAEHNGGHEVEKVAYEVLEKVFHNNSSNNSFLTRMCLT